MNADRQLNSADFQWILGANTYNTGHPADWTTGDFNGDQLCTSQDIQLILGTGLWPTPFGETYWPPGGAPAGGGGEGGQDPGGGEFELIVTPAGAIGEVDDATVRCWILASPQRVFRFFDLDGEHAYADALPDRRDEFDFGGVELLDSVALSYTIEARGGDFQGTVVWSSAEVDNMEADRSKLIATLAYYSDYYVSGDELRVELAGAAEALADVDFLAFLEQFDPRSDDHDASSRDPLAQLFFLYGICG